MSKDTIVSIAKLAIKSYNFLPDNLINKNKYKDLETALKKAANSPSSEQNFSTLVKAI